MAEETLEQVSRKLEEISELLKAIKDEVVEPEEIDIALTPPQDCCAALRSKLMGLWLSIRNRLARVFARSGATTDIQAEPADPLTATIRHRVCRFLWLLSGGISAYARWQFRNVSLRPRDKEDFDDDLVALIGGVVIAVALGSQTIVNSSDVRIRQILVLVFSASIFTLYCVFYSLKRPNLYGIVLILCFIIIIAVFHGAKQRPNLLLTNVTLEHDGVEYHPTAAPQRFFVDIKNAGKTSAEEIVVELRSEQGPVARKMIARLEPGQPTRVAIDARSTLERGRADFVVEVDPDNLVQEWDESVPTKRKVILDKHILPMDLEHGVRFTWHDVSNGTDIGTYLTYEKDERAVPCIAGHEYEVTVWLEDDSCATCSLVSVSRALTVTRLGILDQSTQYPIYLYQPGNKDSGDQKLEWIANDGSNDTERLTIVARVSPPPKE